MRCCGEVDDLTINSNIELTANQDMGNVRILSGYTLTIKSVLEFGEDKEIIIETGGKLIIDGGKLTKCSGANKWKGIKAWGNPFFGQPHAVELKNGAIIENAEIGINTSNIVPGFFLGTLIDLSGAKVTSENSTIRNCDIGINFGPYGYSGDLFSWEDASFIKNATFDNCKSGVKLTSNLGVEFLDTDFQGSKTNYGIEAINSKVDVRNCSFEGSTGIFFAATWPSLVGSVIESNVFYSDDGIIIETQGNASQYQISRNLFKGSNGFIGTGQSLFNLQNNDFIGNIVGTYSFYTGDNLNLIRDNEFQGNKYGNSVFGQNSVEYLNNCFRYSHETDIELYHEASIHLGQGTSEVAAGNCFTKQGVPQILTGDNTETFDYFVKVNTIPQSCKSPGSGNFNVLSSDFESNLECGSGIWGNLPTEYKLCIIPHKLNEKKNMEAALKAEIHRVKNDQLISTRLKKLLIADYERCLKKLIGLRGLQIIKEEQDGREKALTYFSSQPLFSHKIMAYAIMMESGELARATTYLKRLNTKNSEQADFVTANNLYLTYLSNRAKFVLSNPAKESLRTKAMAPNELSGYIRTIYYVLTGERLHVPIEHLDFTSPRTKPFTGISSTINIKTYPNPLSENEYYINIPSEWGDQVYNILVKDVSGSVISKNNGNSGNNTINMTGLSSGLYIVEISTSLERLYTGKLVKI